VKRGLKRVKLSTVRSRFQETAGEAQKAGKGLAGAVVIVKSGD
jgi:hypothetical protein